MTVRHYCDAAYTLIIAEHQRAGMALDDALEKLGDWAVAYGRSQEDREAERVARQNEAGMRQLQTLMGGGL